MATENTTIEGMLQDTIVSGQNSQGIEVHGKLTRLTRFAAAFEIYNPGVVLQSSEILTDFKIVAEGRGVYTGRAVLENLVDAGTVISCEATLDESGWVDVEMFPPAGWNSRIKRDFSKFLQASLQSFAILPEFKIAVADLQVLLMDLRNWLEQVELGIRSQPDKNRAEMERETIEALKDQVIETTLRVLERFENAAKNVPAEARPAHMNYMKRQIHPLVLCAPFIHRTYFKPLGYAGDYEMVSMMVRDPFEGGSLFAKILNSVFLNTPPVQAHRDRLAYLTEMLRIETVRTLQKKKTARIFNLGCGPAKEVQNFLRHHEVAQFADFTLLDFNDETLASTTKVLRGINERYAPGARIQFVKKSVNQLIKEAFKLQSYSRSFDVVYCAGLFDYLTDPVCKKLMNIFYDMVAPGGLLVATNVDDSNPSKGWMEYVLDWHLVYRNGVDFANVRPDGASTDDVQIKAVGTGVNIFIEVRKPANA